VSIANRISRATGFVSIATLLARLGTFLANLVIIRLLSHEQLGALGLFESWLTIATMFSLFGLTTAVSKFIAEYLETNAQHVGGIIGAALLLASLLGLVTGACISLAAQTELVQALGTPGVLLREYGGIFAGLIIVSTLRQMLTSIIYGLQSFHILIIVNIVVGITSFPVSSILAALYQLTGALQARLVLGLIETAVLGYLAGRTVHRAGIRLSFRTPRLYVTQLLAFGFPTFVGQLAANPVQPLAMSVLASQANGLQQLGLFTAAGRLSSLVSFLPGAMATTLIPIFSSEWGQGDRARYSKGILLALRMFWLATTPIVVFFVACSPLLLTTLYGVSFRPAWTLAVGLLVLTLLSSLNETSDRSLVAAGRIWLSTSGNFIWAVLFLGAALWLIPQYQVTGYLISYIITFMIYVGLQLVWLQRLFSIRVKDLLPMLGSAVPLLGASYLVAFFGNSFFQLLGAFALFGLSLVSEWYLLLTEKERLAIKARMQKLRLAGALLMSQLHTRPRF